MIRSRREEYFNLFHVILLVKSFIYYYNKYLLAVVITDKVEEYINFTFKNPIDREIITHLYRGYFTLSPRTRTASAIFSQISPCKRSTFDKRLEVLRSPRMNAITRRTAEPSELDPSRWDKIIRGEPVPPAPRHRLPFLYFIHHDLTERLKDVEGFAAMVNWARDARKRGVLEPDDQYFNDAAIIERFLDREERGIFVPGPLVPPKK